MIGHYYCKEKCLISTWNMIDTNNSMTFHVNMMKTQKVYSYHVYLYIFDMVI